METRHCAKCGIPVLRHKCRKSKTSVCPKCSRPTALETFLNRVQKTDGCWIWIGSIDKRGYGTITIGKGESQKTWRAHRLSLFLHGNTPPDEKFVLHRCDNPKCVNPDHLFFGTAKDNSDDMIRKGRNLTGEDLPQSKLNWKKVNQMRSCKSRPRGWQRKFAQKFQISESVVSEIVSYKMWIPKAPAVASGLPFQSNQLS